LNAVLDGRSKLKLSTQLRQDHESGDFGLALEGYSERAKILEDALKEAADCLDRCRYSEQPLARKLYAILESNAELTG
jgi:hypothetical protein